MPTPPPGENAAQDASELPGQLSLWAPAKSTVHLLLQLMHGLGGSEWVEMERLPKQDYEL